MTGTASRQIKHRVRNGDPYRIWYQVFSIIFPDAPRPLSPYSESDSSGWYECTLTIFRILGPQAHTLYETIRNSPAGYKLPVVRQHIVDQAYAIFEPEYQAAVGPDVPTPTERAEIDNLDLPAEPQAAPAPTASSELAFDMFQRLGNIPLDAYSGDPYDNGEFDVSQAGGGDDGPLDLFRPENQGSELFTTLADFGQDPITWLSSLSPSLPSAAYQTRFSIDRGVPL